MNVKVLNNKDLDKINNLYKFMLVGDNVVVRTLKSETYHNINNDINLNVKSLKHRIIIKSSTIKLWKDNYLNESLLDIQNICNLLDCARLEKSLENIDMQLHRNKIRINII